MSSFHGRLALEQFAAEPPVQAEKAGAKLKQTLNPAAGDRQGEKNGCVVNRDFPWPVSERQSASLLPSSGTPQPVSV